MGSANVDWKETAKGYVLKVDVPGFNKEEVKVAVEGGGILQISGERGDCEGGEEGTDKWHCMERSKGRFVWRLRMPENANLDEVEAAVENGVLTLTVP
ncbi:17.6 kDa class I heat shock protein-like [Salvia hispanica]|uniref:17.6 kDa class I heat shock protein-like n=1 Tax=Salvia hispanica TaxID=49212 RepID=UPI002009BDD8|nr:17.6 kDa class I heat shock protein-like [Salvia hispanica]